LIDRHPNIGNGAVGGCRSRVRHDAADDPKRDRDTAPLKRPPATVYVTPVVTEYLCRHHPPAL
jgi:hypothetical protein